MPPPRDQSVLIKNFSEVTASLPQERLNHDVVEATVSNYIFVKFAFPLGKVCESGPPRHLKVVLESVT